MKDLNPDALDRHITGNYGADQYPELCPVCADPPSYCQGHGEIGDPDGYLILQAHLNDIHDDCHPDGCEEAPEINLGERSTS